MNSTDADNSLQNPVNTMEQTLLAYCRRQGLFRLGDRVIVACSGGADSMALLCFLLRCKAELGITVMAAHVDHGIRGEAAHADARFVAEFCRTHHVPFFLYDAAASGCRFPPNPSENWARSLRYTWFDALAAQQHACIATAHTLSDQAETVLFRMARGTGLHGMAGIPAVRGVTAGHFVPDKERYHGILRRPLGNTMFRTKAISAMPMPATVSAIMLFRHCKPSIRRQSGPWGGCATSCRS